MILMLILFICIIIHWYITNFKYIRKLQKEIYFSNAQVNKLEDEVDRLNNIIKNNEYNTKLYYKSINYIADDDHELIEADDTIYMAIGYTTDISKAKNFIKDYDSYYEIENEKTEG